MVWDRTRAWETRLGTACAACESSMTFWQIRQRFKDLGRERSALDMFQIIEQPMAEVCQSHKAEEGKLSGFLQMHDGR